MTSAPTPFRLPLLWVGLDALGIGLLVTGLLIVDGVLTTPLLAAYGLALCIVGGLLMGFATVLILRAVLAHRGQRPSKH